MTLRRVRLLVLGTLAAGLLVLAGCAGKAEVIQFPAGSQNLRCVGIEKRNLHAIEAPALDVREDREVFVRDIAGPEQHVHSKSHFVAPSTSALLIL